MGMHSTYTATHYKDLNIDWQARAVTRHGEDILLTPPELCLVASENWRKEQEKKKACAPSLKDVSTCPIILFYRH